jgi:hypothetical protein
MSITYLCLSSTTNVKRRNSIGEYISKNSFLSTSLNRQQARSYLYSAVTSNDIEEVFFETDANPRLDKIKAFSKISSLSFFPGEEEVPL